MIRMLTAAAAAALFALPALAQDVSAGAEAARDQARDLERIAPPGESSESEAMGGETQGRVPGRDDVQDQTAEVPGDDADVTAIPGGADELDQNQGSQRSEGSLPPIEDDQTARVPGDDADLPQQDQSAGEAEQGLPPIEDDQTAEVPGEDTGGLPALGQEGSEAPAQGGALDSERDLLRPGAEPVR